MMHSLPDRFPFPGTGLKVLQGSGILEQWSHWASTRWAELQEGREGRYPWLPWGCSHPTWAGRSWSRAGQGMKCPSPIASFFDTSTV